MPKQGYHIQMRHLPAEFEEQSFIQVVFPHTKSDWIDYIEDAEKNFIDIINAIAKYQQCLVDCDDISRVKAHFPSHTNIHFITSLSNLIWITRIGVVKVCSVLVTFCNHILRVM